MSGDSPKAAPDGPPLEQAARRPRPDAPLPDVPPFRELPKDDGERGPATGDIRLPARFGKYLLLRELATGGMAELFLALQRSVAGFEKVLVVKRVLPHLARDETFIQMLLTEARIAATLNHPNVAHVYDVGEHEGSYYIAMEHVHGEDLRTVVRQMRKKGIERFPLEHALAIGIGAASGLAYAHERTGLDGEPLRIVHRDVSPQNIVVSFSGDVKVVDFGIAKAGRSRMEDTNAGRLKGKIPYMSPEQAAGRELDARSDLFSLGIVLYELVTGRRLFKGRDELDSLRMITGGDIPRPRELEPDVPEPLEEILMRVLEKDPERRTPSARVLQGELEALVRDRRLEVSPLSLGAWMRELFAEELVAQDAMLHEAREVAVTLPPGPLPPAAPAPTGAAEAATPAADAPLRGRRAWGAILAAVVLAGIAVLASGRGGDEVPAAPAADPPAASAPAAASDDVGGSLSALLRVRSDPPGARIVVDGEATGLVTPATVTGLAPDVPHDVELLLPGHAPSRHRLVLAGGAVDDLTAELTPAGGPAP